jgi:hypothetical protein
MSPEQMLATPLDRRADLFAVGIVLWECLTGQRLFMADDAVGTMGLVMKATIAPPSTLVPNLPPGLDTVVLKALEREADRRYQTGLEMLAAIEGALVPAPPQEVGRVVETLARDILATRASLEITAASTGGRAGSLLAEVDRCVTGAGAPLAITLGDPAGIGPEVILGAWVRLRATRKAPPAFVVGGPELLRAAAERLGIDCPIVPIAEPAEAIFASAVGLPVLAGLDGGLTPSRPSPEGARLALASLQWGVRFALSEVAVGLVTAPVAKGALAAVSAICVLRVSPSSSRADVALGCWPI